jgi:hypothetical protein
MLWCWPHKCCGANRTNVVVLTAQILWCWPHKCCGADRTNVVVLTAQMLWCWPHKWAIFFFRSTVELEQITKICNKIPTLKSYWLGKLYGFRGAEDGDSEKYEDRKLKQMLWFSNFIKWRPFFSIAQHPLVGQGLFIIEVSRSHSDTTIGRTLQDEW